MDSCDTDCVIPVMCRGLGGARRVKTVASGGLGACWEDRLRVCATMVHVNSKLNP